MQFGLPDEACRAQILHQYAKHLSEEDAASVAESSPGMAGRDLKDISEQAERRWASKVGALFLVTVCVYQMPTYLELSNSCSALDYFICYLAWPA